MKDHRLTARVSPALHELAHNLGGQSAGLRAALLIAAASLDYDMRLYKDDVRGVLSDELAPEVAEAVQSIYLAVCAPPVCQAKPKRQPRGEHPVPPPVTEQSPDEPVTQRVADPLQDVGIAV